MKQFAVRSGLELIAVIAEITGDNRRPGSLSEGYFIYYRHHPVYGWTCCRGESTLEKATEFASRLVGGGSVSIKEVTNG